MFFPLLLLFLFCAAFISGLAMVWLVLHWRRKYQSALQLLPRQLPGSDPDQALLQPEFRPRPVSWLAVRGTDVRAVQMALRLNNPTPCTWTEGLTAERKLFIAPPVNGWILIFGSRLPEPGEDVDDCFKFLVELSRELGDIQFFSAGHIPPQHAWARLEAGRVVRAYAWAGSTLWNQGIKTRDELKLGMKCFHYFEGPVSIPFGEPDVIFTNTEKVPSLAAQWSLDPAAIDERIIEHVCGIAGEPARFH